MITGRYEREVKMYPGHFGFSEQPFADSSVTDFFYEGANRGATLDALIYVLTHGEGVEGIIQVIGADGSGKTTLCRSLIKRLPAQMQAVYLAKPDFSREEFLHSIMNELNAGGTESATTAVTAVQATVTIEDLQRALTEKHANGGQVVLLVDEAHTLSAEVLEEVLALYDLESPRHKLLQIVLFGQVELENKLASPQMRKLNDRVTHRFALQPFNTKAVEEYLVRRTGTARYPHADIFSAKAAKLISRASGGLVRQIDILADKSLLAASIAETREVDARHVNAAVEDSGIKRSASGESWRQWRVFLGHCTVDAVAVFSTVAVVALGVLGWHDIRSPSPEITSLVASMPLEATTPAPVSIPAPGPVYSTMVPAIPPSAPPSVSAPAAASSGISRSVSAVASTPAPPEAVAGIAPSAESKPVAEIGQRSTARTHIAGVELAGNALLEQRLEATTNTMRKTDKNFYTIQLFATENIQPDRMERFLLRARSQVDLSDLYVHPVSNGDQAKFIVTYGIYPSRDEADAAVAGLPEKYQSSFQPALFALSDLP